VLCRCAPILLLMGILLLAAGTWVAGCSDPVKEYRVLSFFFDGVPPPPGMAPPEAEWVIAPWGEKMRADDPRAKAFAGRGRPVSASQPAVEAPAILHAPYEKRLCMECHSSQTSFQTAATAETCRKCHANYYILRRNDWVHGPVALGKCAMCHRPHKSQYPALLTGPMPELCFSCHNGPRTLARPYHARIDTHRCSECHDPHSAGNRLLLVDSTTYARRSPHAKVQPSAHSSWDKKTCTNCHAPGQSNRLVGDVNQQCVSCHKKLHAEVTADPLAFHEPLRKGQCTTCHVPHRSVLPHLLRPEAERLCLQCHKLKQIQTDAHPPVTRVECLLCHTGHRSPLKHLLRPAPGITPSGAASQPASAPWTAAASQPASQPSSMPAAHAEVPLASQPASAPAGGSTTQPATPPASSPATPSGPPATATTPTVEGRP
jgi:predicted CXXCH cytochrome family protein